VKARQLAFVSGTVSHRSPAADPTAPCNRPLRARQFSLGLLFPYCGEALDVDVQGSLDLAAASASMQAATSR
jgi:hypothetical protein